MAATVLIQEHNTAGNTPTDKTGLVIRFKKADDKEPDANNPLVKPSSGNTDRSYEKWLRLNATIAPTGSITNEQFYTSGNCGTGATVYIRTTNAGTYSTPAIPSDDTAGTNATTYVTGSRKNMMAVNTGAKTGTGEFGDFAVLWMTIADTITAPQNPTSSITLNFSFDET